MAQYVTCMVPYILRLVLFVLNVFHNAYGPLCQHFRINNHFQNKNHSLEVRVQNPFGVLKVNVSGMESFLK